MFFMILNTILSYLDKRYFGAKEKGKDPERKDTSNLPTSNLPNKKGNQL